MPSQNKSPQNLVVPVSTGSQNKNQSPLVVPLPSSQNQGTFQRYASSLVALGFKKKKFKIEVLCKQLCMSLFCILFTFTLNFHHDLGQKFQLVPVGSSQSQNKDRSPVVIPLPQSIHASKNSQILPVDLTKDKGIDFF